MFLRGLNWSVLVPIIIGSGTLFYGLGTTYQKLISDEDTFLLLAEFVKGLPYYPYVIFPNNLGTTHSLLVYLIRLSLDVFGYSNFALRFVPAVYGLLGIVVFFYFLKNVFNSQRIAFLGACLLSVTHWYLAISRVAIEISEVLFFSLLNLLLLVLFIRSKGNLKIGKFEISKSAVYIFLTGLSFGLVQHTYQSARIYVLFYVFFFPLYWLTNRLEIRKLVIQASFFTFGLVLAVAPLVYVYFDHPESFDSRRSELVFYQNLSPSELIWSLKESTLRTLGMFHLRGYDVSCYNVPGKPMLDWVTGVLFVIGIFLSFRYLDRHMKLVFYLFFVVALVPSIISYWPASPHGLRAAGVIIPTIGFSAIALDKVTRLSGRYWVLMAALLFGLIGFFNLKAYFVDQAALQTDCFRKDINNIAEVKRKFLEENGVGLIR